MPIRLWRVGRVPADPKPGTTSILSSRAVPRMAVPSIRVGAALGRRAAAFKFAQAAGGGRLQAVGLQAVVHYHWRGGDDGSWIERLRDDGDARPQTADCPTRPALDGAAPQRHPGQGRGRGGSDATLAGAACALKPPLRCVDPKGGPIVSNGRERGRTVPVPAGRPWLLSGTADAVASAERSATGGRPGSARQRPGPAQIRACLGPRFVIRPQ